MSLENFFLLVALSYSVTGDDISKNLLVIDSKAILAKYLLVNSNVNGFISMS